MTFITIIDDENDSFSKPSMSALHVMNTGSTNNDIPTSDVVHAYENVYNDDNDDPNNTTTLNTKGTKERSNENNDIPSNERLLGIAFITFMSFATTQLIFAFIADSQAMMGDSAAMVVDSITYLFNYIAEREKNQYNTIHKQHNNQQQKDQNDTTVSNKINTTTETTESSNAALLHSSENNPSLMDDTDETSTSIDPIKLNRIHKRNRRKVLLQLEIIPPIISVITLIIVTIFITHKAIKIIILDHHRSKSEQSLPNLQLMLFFSLINLGLDMINVFQFARAKHLLGYTTTNTKHHHDLAGTKEVTLALDNDTTSDDNNNNNLDDDDDVSNMSETIRLSDTIHKLNNYKMNNVQIKCDDNYNANISTIVSPSSSLASLKVPSKIIQQQRTCDCQSNESTHLCQHYNNNSSSPTNQKSSRNKYHHHNTSKIRNDIERNNTTTVQSTYCKCPNYTDLNREHTEQCFTGRFISESEHNNNCVAYRHDDNDDNDDEENQTNLNMCSAYTHVFADTLRSIAVLIAAIMAELIPNITPEVADSAAAVIVSILILLSLIPLLQGLKNSIQELNTIYEEERYEMTVLLLRPAPIDHVELT